MARTATKSETEKQLESRGIPDVVFLKKLKKLDKNFGKPRMFGQKSFNPDSDSRMDTELEFTGNSIPGAVRNITPRWDKIKNQWAFYGTYQDLSRIADKLKLRDSDQNIVRPNEDSIKNPEDPFFNHVKLWNNSEIKMNEGHVTFTTIDNPLHEFYARSYMGDPFVVNKLETQSASQVAGAELEIWSPKAEKKITKKSADKDDLATSRLMNMSDETKRVIALIMKPSGYSELNDDLELLHVELRAAALNTDTVRQFGNQTWQDRFLELSELPDAKLHTIATIIEAKMKALITRKNNTYYFNGEALYNLDNGGVQKNITNEIELIEFFLNPDNDDLFNKLDDRLTEIRKQLSNIIE